MKLSRGAQRLLDLIRWYRSRFGRVFPFQKKLAAHLKVTIRQLQRYVQELRDNFLLRVQRCGRNASEYELAPEALTKENVVAMSRPLRGEPVSSFMSVSAPHAARPERKPPQREDACTRLMRKLWEEERANPGTHILPGERISA